MSSDARHALKTVRRCLATWRFALLPHFARRDGAARHGMAWGDVRAVCDDPADFRDGGADDLGRAKWIATGTAADGLGVGIVCVLDADERGDVTVLITIYFEDQP